MAKTHSQPWNSFQSFEIPKQGSRQKPKAGKFAIRESLGTDVMGEEDE